MSTAAERIKEARERDEAAAFVQPEGSETEPETEMGAREAMSRQMG